MLRNRLYYFFINIFKSLKLHDEYTNRRTNKITKWISVSFRQQPGQVRDHPGQTSVDTGSDVRLITAQDVPPTYYYYQMSPH